ncbi:MAG: DUF2244 domain-containing protein [Alphaproteobacteria bacterium]|nr:DUF2244 domain-containing protein [Alphaproteobacteria bacterium]
MTDGTARSSTPPTFQVVLYPNRSLGSTGFAVLMGLIVLVSALVGAGFALVGAWPVTGFLGLDVLLLYLAFRWNFRDAARADFIRLDDQGLSVRRIAPNGRREEWRFETAWVQVVVEERRLLLRSHGRELVLGAYLTKEERASLADALKEAIQARRNAPDAS